jgi:hypothetical protein
MRSGDYDNIWHAGDLPNWCFELAVLASVSRAKGLLTGRLADVGKVLSDIADLATRGILRKYNAGGRSTSYELKCAASIC